ncbi:MAG: hypothetical protein Q8N53_16130 [Longimicrobiales bacterium]|nr:hypothetical protein [Longimicrobiales bacterium]
MKIWKDGDESRAICPTCERRTVVVFQRRTVELKNPDVGVPDVLVAVCRECDGITMVPHQSTPKLRAGIERPNEVVNVRLPGHLTDVLSLLAERRAPGARSNSAVILRFLLHQFGDDAAFARRVRDHLEDPLAQGPADHGLSVRVPSHVLVAVDDMAELVGVATRTDVFRGVIATAKEDVLDERDPALAHLMERALSAVA